MRVAGTYAYPAPPDRVLSRLLDPAALRSRIPGCETRESAGEDRWSARLSVGAAPGFVMGQFFDCLRTKL